MSEPVVKQETEILLRAKLHEAHLKAVIRDSLDRDTQKEAIKEAMREWLDEQYAAFGRWSLRSLLALLISALLYWWAAVHGWTK